MRTIPKLTYRRVFSAKDISAVARLAQGIWREHYDRLLGTGQTAYMLSVFQSDTAISRQILSGTVYKLCYVGDTLIGYYAILREGSSMVIQRIYLLKEHRGAGHAREILEDILAQSGGCTELRLAINKVNVDSMAAYRHLGFQFCGERTVEIGAGYVMSEYLMRMPLDAGVPQPVTAD